METRPAGPAPGGGAVVTGGDLRELAGRVRAAVRPMVRRRSGVLVCVVPQPAADVRTPAAEAAAAFVRSAAADLDYYGVPVTGVLAADPAPAGRLAAVLATGAGTAGTVYLAGGTELARLAPIAVDRTLVRSDRLLRTADVATALGGPDRPAGGDGPADPGAAGEPTRAGGAGGAGPLAGRVVVVTGGGGGIGAAVAAGLAADGAAVVLADLGCDPDGAGRDPGPAAAVAAGIVGRGGRAVAACVDVSRPDDCAALVRRAVTAFGRLDAVVHAAGVVRPALVFESTDEDWDAVHRVHVTGAAALVGSALPELRRHGSGRVVLLSSRSVTGSPGQTAYAAAKGAVLGLAHQLAAELAGTGVTVATVLPSGRTRASAPERLDSRRRRIELLRARHHGITDPAAYRAAPEQDPATNAAMVSWLCSPAGAAGHGGIFGTGGGRVDRYRPSAVAARRPWPAVLTAGDL